MPPDPDPARLEDPSLRQPAVISRKRSAAAARVLASYGIAALLLWGLERSQLAEAVNLLVYDLITNLRPADSGRPQPIAIIGISEADIRTYGWPIDDSLLCRAIDRLDVSPTQVAVIDYKLSRPGNPKARLDALLLKDFQLPLYLFVARQQYPKRAVDAAWVGLRKSESLVLSRVLRDEAYSLDDVLAVDLETRRRLAESEVPNLANSVHALQASLRRGDFGARPLDCKYCHLRSVCRISARRLLDEREVE